MTPKEKAVTNYVREKHNQDECVGFIDGYTQCQEDMADVMENFLEYVRDNYTGFGAPHLVHNKGGQRKTKAIVEDFIETLNKQD